MQYPGLPEYVEKASAFVQHAGQINLLVENPMIRS
jgi:hypothetical protein